MCHCLSEFGDEHESIFLPFSNTLMPEFAVESARKEASKWSESAASHLPFWHIRAGPGMSTCLSVWRCDKFAKTETFWTSADSNGPAGCVSTSEPSAWPSRAPEEICSSWTQNLWSWNQRTFETWQLNCYLTRCWLLLLNRLSVSDLVHDEREMILD